MIYHAKNINADNCLMLTYTTICEVELPTTKADFDQRAVDTIYH